MNSKQGICARRGDEGLDIPLSGEAQSIPSGREEIYLQFGNEQLNYGSYIIFSSVLYREETESYKRSSVESKDYGDKREPAEGGSCAAALNPTPLLKKSREASRAGWRQRQARLVFII